MQKRFFFFQLFILLSTISVAQPQPCDPDNPEMTSFCADACVICDINGFVGRHAGTEDGEAPPGFEGECTQVQHNMQWIAFIAGSIDLSVRLSVSNCDKQLGLEFGLYKGIDCGDFGRISNCFGGQNSIPPGLSGTITNTEPLVIGQYYYIVMDGALEDNCDWTFTVIEGSTSFSDLLEASTITGDLTPCLDMTETYQIEAQVGATLFDWQLDGQPVGDINSSSIELGFDTPGSYSLCVAPGNACNSTIPFCETIVVRPSPVLELVDAFCSDNCYEVAGTQVCDSGDYSFTVMTAEGCDSIINASLTELEVPVTDIALDICDGDTIFIADVPYDLTGSYQETLIGQNSCDSIINLDLNILQCNIEGETQVTNIQCNGESNGGVEFVLSSGVPPFTYEWERIDNSQVSGSGTINNLTDQVVISNLSFGTYVITVDDGMGNFEILIADVRQPDPLVVEISDLDQNGFTIACAGESDGTLEATVTGGTTDYTYDWSNSDNTASITSIAEGSYFLFVTDANGCTAEADFQATSPPPLFMEAEFLDPSCEGLESGVINVLSADGGTGTYEYSLNGSSFSDDTTFTGIGSGIQVLTLRDENGCLFEVMETLTAPQIPTVELGDDLRVALGDSVLISGSINNIDIQNIDWVSSDLISCNDCIETYITPTNSQQVVLQVSSIDDCTAADSLRLTVEKFRNFYAPTIMQRTAVGDDRYFNLFSSLEVDSYTLQVYDRWGNLVFDGQDLRGDNTQEGWDGRYNGLNVKPGVFVWKAEITFIDNETINYTGSITVIE